MLGVQNIRLRTNKKSSRLYGNTKAHEVSLAMSFGNPLRLCFMMEERDFEIVPNQGAKSRVWDHFGFIKTKDDPVVDKTRVVCKLCLTKLKFSRNTTNLAGNMGTVGDKLSNCQ